jgi:CBS domain-containing protein
MHLAMVARRRSVCIDREATIVAASRLMREQHVDDLVVTEMRDGKAMPTGIASARDIVTRIVAMGLDPSVLTVGDIVWARPGAVHVHDGVSEILAHMSAADGEVLPIVDSEGGAVGVLSMEDLLQALAGSDHSRAHRPHRR